MGKGISGARIAELERIAYDVPEHGGDFDAIFKQVEKVTSVGMSIERALEIQGGLGPASTTGHRMWSAGWLFGVARTLGLFEQCDAAKVQAGRIAKGIESHAVRSGLRDRWRSGVTLGIQAVLDDPDLRPADLGWSLPSAQKGW